MSKVLACTAMMVTAPIPTMLGALLLCLLLWVVGQTLERTLETLSLKCGRSVEVPCMIRERSTTKQIFPFCCLSRSGKHIDRPANDQVLILSPIRTAKSFLFRFVNLGKHVTQSQKIITNSL